MRWRATADVRNVLMAMVIFLIITSFSWYGFIIVIFNVSLNKDIVKQIGISKLSKWVGVMRIVKLCGLSSITHGVISPVTKARPKTSRIPVWNMSMKISNPNCQINIYIPISQNNTDGGSHYMIGRIG